jgi:hypothetical protein
MIRDVITTKPGTDMRSEPYDETCYAYKCASGANNNTNQRKRPARRATMIIGTFIQLNRQTSQQADANKNIAKDWGMNDCMHVVFGLHRVSLGLELSGCAGNKPSPSNPRGIQ